MSTHHKTAPRRSAALARALFGLHLLVGPLLFFTGSLEAFEYPKLLLLRTLGIVWTSTGLLLLAQRLAARQSVRPILAVFRDPLAASLLLFVASATLSTFTSISPRTSWAGAHESFGGLSTWLALTAVFFAARRLFRGGAAWHETLIAACLAALPASIYALAQLVGRDPFDWVRTHAFMGLERVFGTLGNPTFLGGYLATTLPLTLYLAWSAWRRGPKTLLPLWGAVAVLSLAGLGATLARGPWLAALAGVVVLGTGTLVAARTGAVRRRVVAATLVVLVVASAGLWALPRGRAILRAMMHRVVLTVETRPQIRPVGGLSLEEEPRLALWSAAWRMFKASPWVGVGTDAFQLAYQGERSLSVWRVEGHRTPQRAHNELLNTLATQGLLGGSAALLLVASAWRAALRARARNPEHQPLLLATLAALVAFAVHVAFSFTIVPLGVLVMTLLALLSQLSADPQPDDEPHRAPRAIRVGLTALACAGAVAAFVQFVGRPFGGDLLAHTGILLEAQRPGSSVPFLARAVQLDPGRDLLWGRLGLAYFRGAETRRGSSERGGWLAEAGASFERAAELVPVNAYHQLAVARVLTQLALERPPRVPPSLAIERFERALLLDPRNLYIYSEAGNAAVELGDMRSAGSFGRRCEQLDATYGPCLWVLGRLELPLALRASSQDPAIRRALFSSAGDALQRAALARWQGDDTAQAVAASHGAAALVMAERFGEGLALAQLSVQKAPNYADGRFNLGKAHERLGQLAEAEWEYRQTLRIDPRHTEARKALDQLALRRAGK